VRELSVNTFLTLDGVMQAPGGPEEDPSDAFEHGGWSFGYWDEQMQKAMGESMSTPFDLVLGRANLIQTLLEHGLIDEFRLWIFPLVLDKRKRLFEGGTLPAGLEPASSRVSSTGVIMATYRSGAEIKGDCFVAEQPSEAELARRAAQER
jgi:dihydrofolate reductase